MAAQLLSSLSLYELEQTVAQYPWFAAARHELFLRQLRSGGADAVEAAGRVALFIPSREILYREAAEIRAEKPAITQDGSAADKPKAKYVIAGGDYFSRGDFEDLERSGESINLSGLHITGFEASEGTALADATTASISEEDAATEIYTETLGGIYARQGHFDRAIEVYKKLILLYPEKSAYFASLIDKIETKINNN